jgi:hypothetical protein
MSAVVKFHKDGNSMAISTDAASEAEFMAAVVETLAAKIDSLEHATDWEFQLERWLPQIVNVCCKLRGYKADVTEHRVIVAGEWYPADMVQAFTRTKEIERELVS